METKQQDGVVWMIEAKNDDGTWDTYHMSHETYEEAKEVFEGLSKTNTKRVVKYVRVEE